MPSTDEWQLIDIVAKVDSPAAQGGVAQPVTIDGEEVDAKRVRLRRMSNDSVWRAYLDSELLRPGTVICHGETVLHRQPESS